MASNPTTPVIKPTHDATTASKRHKSYLQWCCPGKVCEKDFYGVTDRLEVIKFRPLFKAFIHYNKEGEVVSSLPYSKKFSEYSFDFADYNASWRMEEKFVTTKEVSALGRDRISLYWRLLDKYSARYDRNGYTRNLVDVVVLIPERNIIAEEHFCFRYMSRRQGEPAVILPQLLRQAMARLYNRFYVFEGEQFIPLQITFRCSPEKCDHKDSDEIPDTLLTMIPDWFYSRLYPNDTSAIRVSVVS